MTGWWELRPHFSRRGSWSNSASGCSGVSRSVPPQQVSVRVGRRKTAEPSHSCCSRGAAGLFRRKSVRYSKEHSLSSKHELFVTSYSKSQRWDCHVHIRRACLAVHPSGRLRAANHSPHRPGVPMPRQTILNRNACARSADGIQYRQVCPFSGSFGWQGTGDYRNHSDCHNDRSSVVKRCIVGVDTDRRWAHGDGLEELR